MFKKGEPIPPLLVLSPTRKSERKANVIHALEGVFTSKLDFLHDLLLVKTSTTANGKD